MFDLDHYRPHMLPKLRAPSIMEAAAGMPCTVRISSFIPGHTCSGRNTTVGAHLPVFGKGMSTKVTDLAVAFCCQHCHDLIDGRDHRWSYLREQYPTAIMERMLNALIETQTLCLMQGIIIVPRAELI